MWVGGSAFTSCPPRSISGHSTLTLLPIKARYTYCLLSGLVLRLRGEVGGVNAGNPFLLSFPSRPRKNLTCNVDGAPSVIGVK